MGYIEWLAARRLDARRRQDTLNTDKPETLPAAQPVKDPLFPCESRTGGLRPRQNGQIRHNCAIPAELKPFDPAARFPKPFRAEPLVTVQHVVTNKDGKII